MMKVNQNQANSGFSLVELLVVISIIGGLAALLLVNFVGIRGRASDASAKANLDQMKKALRLYYNDFQQYPASTTDGNMLGCGSDGTSQCSPGGTFATGSTEYMKQLPETYEYYSDGINEFIIEVTLTNQSDQDITQSQERCNPSARGYYPNTVTDTTYLVCED